VSTSFHDAVRRLRAARVDAGRPLPDATPHPSPHLTTRSPAEAHPRPGGGAGLGPSSGSSDEAGDATLATP
jgi:hypothetical protein